MKKQVLTLTICLVMTASSTLAASTVSTTKQVAPVPAGCPCKLGQPCDEKMTKEQFKQKMEEKMAKRREALYCKLGLTPEQKAKAVSMDTKNRTEAKALIDKIQEEKAKLIDLKSKNACPVKVLEQKQKLKSAHKALRKHFAASEKNFETILTKDQLAKFNVIKEERKANFKKHCKGKGHYKCKKGCPCHKHPRTFEPPVK